MITNISEKDGAEQSGPGYDPQAAVMRWLPLATIAILTPGGSILTRDVLLRNTMINEWCYCDDNR